MIKKETLEAVIQAFKNVLGIHQVDCLTNTQLIEAIIGELQEEPEEISTYSGEANVCGFGRFTEKEIEPNWDEEYYD